MEINLGSTAAWQPLWIAAFEYIYTMHHWAASTDGVNFKVICYPATTNEPVACIGQWSQDFDTTTSMIIRSPGRPCSIGSAGIGALMMISQDLQLSLGRGR